MSEEKKPSVMFKRAATVSWQLHMGQGQAYDANGLWSSPE